jgi:hypothetical protein
MHHWQMMYLEVQENHTRKCPELNSNTSVAAFSSTVQIRSMDHHAHF